MKIKGNHLIRQNKCFSSCQWHWNWSLFSFLFGNTIQKYHHNKSQFSMCETWLREFWSTIKSNSTQDVRIQIHKNFSDHLMPYVLNGSVLEEMSWELSRKIKKFYIIFLAFYSLSKYLHISLLMCKRDIKNMFQEQNWFFLFFCWF